MLDIAAICFVLVVGVAVYTIWILKLLEMNKRLTYYIMAQKDSISYNIVNSKIKKKTDIDEKIEREQKEFLDYMKVVSSGVCDDSDVRRFGTTTVEQG
jgi:ATP-dependent Lon protease